MQQVRRAADLSERSRGDMNGELYKWNDMAKQESRKESAILSVN